MTFALRSLVALALPLALVGGCTQPAVMDCTANLGGVWSSADGQRFHITDDGHAVEVFALEPVTAGIADTVASAGFLRLERNKIKDTTGGGLSGFHQEFRQRENRLCRVRTSARIAACSPTLEIELGSVASIDFATCEQSTAVPGSGEKLLELSRSRTLP